MTPEQIRILRRVATQHIEGRRAFEERVGRPSSKPLPQVVIDPHNVLFLLDNLKDGLE